MDRAAIEEYLRMLGSELAANNRTGKILLIWRCRDDPGRRES